MIKRLLLAGFVLSAVSCGERQVPRAMTDGAIKRDLQALRPLRIYFGHQSVGQNIMNGVRDLISDNPGTGINIVTLREDTVLPETFFAEGLIGENQRPDLKCADFGKVLDSLLVRRLDIAMMKFCFVDIQKDTDIEAVIRQYVQTISGLKARHPDVQFIHVTVPLTAGTAAWKRVINSLAGRIGNNDAANGRRMEFNRILKAQFGGDPVFELAALESTRPDRSRESYRYKDQEYLALVPAYASEDGDHLNEAGRKIIARSLIALLAEVASRRVR